MKPAKKSIAKMPVDTQTVTPTVGKALPAASEPAAKPAKKQKSVPAKKAQAASPAPATPAPPPKTVTSKAAVKPVAKKEKPAKVTGVKQATAEKTAKILDSKVAYEGPLFRVLHDHLIEPDGTESHRDVIRHNGSVVILAVDQGTKKQGKKKKDPWVVIERQYRHAAGQYLWELPAGKLDAGEKPLDGAKRELAEETGYKSQKWSPLVEYFASPGFLGESMKVFLAEGLIAGEATPEEDEHIDFRLVKLSELLDLVDKGRIIDGKTLTTVLLYARQLGIKRKR